MLWPREAVSSAESDRAVSQGVTTINTTRDNSGVNLSSHCTRTSGLIAAVEGQAGVLPDIFIPVLQ